MIIRPISNCLLHKKQITYFCKTCNSSNCDDCLDKKRNPNHNFFDLTKEIITKSKIDDLKIEVKLEKNFFSQKLNINNLIEFYNNNENMKKYKDKIPSNILFINNNFLRILDYNIKHESLISQLKENLLDNYKKYPNDYFTIQNILSIDIIFNIKDKNIVKNNENKIIEYVLVNSINILEKYQKKYLFEYMDIMIKKFDIPKAKINIYTGFLFTFHRPPFIYIENTNKILYFGKGIYCINIKKLEVIKVNDDNFFNGLPNYVNYNFIKNNKFILLIQDNKKNDIKICEYDYKNNKINEIYSKIYIRNNPLNMIEYAYMLFEEKYILLKHCMGDPEILFKKNNNNYEHLCEFKIYNNKPLYTIIPIDQLRTSNEEYFYGMDNTNNVIKFIFYKIYINSEGKINLTTEKILQINGNINDFLFISKNKFLIIYNKQGENNKKFIIYDIKNWQIQTVGFMGEKNISKKFLKGIYNIYEYAKINFFDEEKISDEYSPVFPLKYKNEKNIKYFIGGNISELKIFKYDIREKINFN